MEKEAVMQAGGLGGTLSLEQLEQVATLFGAIESSDSTYYRMVEYEGFVPSKL